MTTEGEDMEVVAQEEQKNNRRDSDSKPEVSPEDWYAKREQLYSDINNSGLNKTLLCKALKATQCPMMPQKFHSDEPAESSWWYGNFFWVERKGSAQIQRFEGGKDAMVPYEKAKDTVEVMLAIDEFLQGVRINTSLGIYQKLQTAYAEVHGEDDGRDDNDAYKQLIPKRGDKIGFCILTLAVLLNGYFVTNNVVTVFSSTNNPYTSGTVQVIAQMVAICEMILYANLLIGEVLMSLGYVIYNSCKQIPQDKEIKSVAVNLREMSTLSLFRYLPSTEMVGNFFKDIRQSISKIFVDFMVDARGWVNPVDVAFGISIFVVEFIAPFLALFAILVKMQGLSFVTNQVDSWAATDWLAFIAFLNQVAGLRVIRNIETTSIQHFVFSGSDAKLDTDELLLLNDWWDSTLVSSVANIGLSDFEKIVFWNSLNPLKIQLLFKDQVGPQGDSLMDMIKDNDDILDEYTRKIDKWMADNANNSDL